MSEGGIKLSTELAAKMQDDPFPNYLGVNILELAPGYAKVKLEIKEYMVNIHRIAHGGVIFTLADVALGTASNAHGQNAVAINVSINYIKAGKPGEVLTAVAKEVHLGRRTATYQITVENERGQLIAMLQGLVFRETK